MSRAIYFFLFLNDFNSSFQLHASGGDSRLCVLSFHSYAGTSKSVKSPNSLCAGRLTQKKWESLDLKCVTACLLRLSRFTRASGTTVLSVRLSCAIITHPMRQTCSYKSQYMMMMMIKSALIS